MRVAILGNSGSGKSTLARRLAARTGAPALDLDTFAWVGGFSSAPNTKPAAELVPDPDKTKKALKLLWISCGNKDGLIRISQGMHAYLKEKQVPHVWHVDGHDHDFQHWRKALYQFSSMIFKPASD